MSADKWIQLVQWVVIAALGAALWFAKREREDGSDKATVQASLGQIPAMIATAIGPFVADVKKLLSDVQKIEQRLATDDTLKVAAAREDGRREAQFTQVKEQVDELDEQVDELDGRVSTIEGTLMMKGRA